MIEGFRLGTLLFDSGSHDTPDLCTCSSHDGGRRGQEQLFRQGVQKEPQSAAIQIMPVPDLRRGRFDRFSFYEAVYGSADLLAATRLAPRENR